MENKQPANLNVYLITDNTYSMKQSCLAAKKSFSEVLVVGNLATGKRCVTIGVIGDYDNGSPDCAQGGFTLLRPGVTDTNAQKLWFEKYMLPSGGEGEPKAYKTLLNFLLREPPGILLLFLDALPHGALGKALDNQGTLEQKFLQQNNMIQDWGTLTTAYKDAGFCAVTFVTGNMFQKNPRALKVYADLGYVVEVKNNKSSDITNAMRFLDNSR